MRLNQYLVEYPAYYMSAVTDWGCAWCLHTLVREGQARKEIPNPLPDPIPRSAVCG